MEKAALYMKCSIFVWDWPSLILTPTLQLQRLTAATEATPMATVMIAYGKR